MTYDYEKLKIELLRFSKYKMLDTMVSHGNNLINTLQRIKTSQNLSEKYITAIVIYENEVIDIIDQNAKKFYLKFLNKFKNDRNKLKVILYSFDTSDKQTKNAYQSFLKTNSEFKLKTQLKRDFEFLKQKIAPLLGVLTAFVFLFVYLGLTEYGIPFGNVADTTSIVSMMVSIFILFTGIIIFGYIIGLYLIIPFAICALLDVTKFINCYNYTNIIIIFGIYLVGVYFVLGRKYPLIISKFHNLFSDFMRHIMLFISSFASLVFIILMLQGIFSSFFSKNIFYSKSAYSFVITGYYNYYSGYPKILKKDNKYYYVPLKDTKLYYAYDTEQVKKRYWDLIKNKKQDNLVESCENNETKLEFRQRYILNNPYIKPAYQTQYFSVNDENITLEDFNLTKLISVNDIDELCNTVK